MALGPPAMQCHLTSLALHVFWGNAEKGVSGLREPALGALPSQLTPTSRVGLGMGHGAMHLLHGLGMGSDR